MSIDEDPDEWMTYFECLKAQIGDIKFSPPMTDRDVVVHVLNNLPEQYNTVLDGLQGRLLKTGSKECTIEDTQDKLRACFEVIKGRSFKKAEKEKALLTQVIEDALQNANLTNEQALAVFLKQFKETCRSCDKYDHKAAKCLDKNSESSIARGNQGRFQGKCFKCGTLGH